MKSRLAALAVAFLAAHLLLLPPTLEDIDSINFALGVRDFDVARHQPHPPGYPVFIVLAKGAAAAFRLAGSPAPELRGLSVVSALAGAALVPLLFLFFRRLGDDRRAWWATVVIACAPLAWFTALRPLSDTTGLAFAVAAQALLAGVILGRTGAPARHLAAGAFLSTLAIGVRSQTFVLTIPLLVWALAVPAVRIALRDRALAAGAAAAGALAWGIPLLAASGGLASYLTALGGQAGEDFSGVVILWTVRSARVAAQALSYTFLWPWGAPWIGALVVAGAAVGAVRIVRLAPRTAAFLIAAFAPYAIFHLLFHEIVTVRYALPLLPPVAYLFVAGVDAGGRIMLPLVASVLAVAGLAQSAAPSLLYARGGSPAFRALDAVRRLPGPLDEETGASAPVVGMHAVARRVAEWERRGLPGRVLVAPHGKEWLPVVEELQRTSEVLFVADPRRTDLALFDPNSLHRLEAFRWGFIEPPFVGGARPGNTDLFRIRSPGWMLERGWALTAEAGGVTASEGGGPHRRPSVAWIRRRGGSALLMMGGRHLGGAGAPSAEITVALDTRVVAQWVVRPGFFVRRQELPAGALDSPRPFVRLSVTSRASGGTAGETAVALEQFDVQSEQIPMLAYEAGWQEPEYNPLTATSWRWMSDRAELWIRPVGRDLTLRVTGESPLRYYDAPPSLRVNIGGGPPVGAFELSADFAQEVRLPHDALVAAGGRVILTSDRYFIPSEREGGADRRRLGLRIYSVRVR